MKRMKVKKLRKKKEMKRVKKKPKKKNLSPRKKSKAQLTFSIVTLLKEPILASQPVMS